MEKQIDPLYLRAEHTAFVYETDLDDSQEGSDKLYLANLLTSELLVLEGSGPVIWDLLDEPKTANTLMTQVAETFEVSVETVEASILSFLSSLENQGFVQH